MTAATSDPTTAATCDPDYLPDDSECVLVDGVLRCPDCGAEA